MTGITARRVLVPAALSAALVLGGAFTAGWLDHGGGTAAWLAACAAALLGMVLAVLAAGSGLATAATRARVAGRGGRAQRAAAGLGLGA
jgi:hypothetical protein